MASILPDKLDNLEFRIHKDTIPVYYNGLILDTLDRLSKDNLSLDDSFEDLCGFESLDLIRNINDIIKGIFTSLVIVKAKTSMRSKTCSLKNIKKAIEKLEKHYEQH